MYDMAKHLKSDCPKAVHICTVCRQLVPSALVDQHAATHFEAMDPTPDDDTWVEEPDDTMKVVEKLG